MDDEDIATEYVNKLDPVRYGSMEASLLNSEVQGMGGVPKNLGEAVRLAQIVEDVRGGERRSVGAIPANRGHLSHRRQQARWPLPRHPKLCVLCGENHKVFSCPSVQECGEYLRKKRAKESAHVKVAMLDLDLDSVHL